MKKHKKNLSYILLLSFILIILPMNISANDLNCNGYPSSRSDSTELNLDKILTEFFAMKKSEFVQQIQRNERIKMGLIDSVGNFVFRLNFEKEIVNYIISKKYDSKKTKFVDSPPDSVFVNMNEAVNNLMLDSIMPGIYYAEFLFATPILWRTEIDNKDAFEILSYLDKNINTTNTKIRKVFEKHVKIFLDEFNDILKNSNSNTNGMFILGHMEFNAEIRDQYKSPAIKTKLFTILKYIKHGTPTNNYNNLLSCIKQDLNENYETNKNTYTRLSVYFQSVADYIKGNLECVGGNNDDEVLSFDCLPKEMNDGNTGIVEIEKSTINNCRKFFVEDKIRVFDDQEYAKINKFGINTFGRLVYVKDNQNKKHFFSKTCTLDQDGKIQKYFSSGRLINFELIQQQITDKIKLSYGVSYKYVIDQDYQSQTILSGINKQNYLIANLVSEVPCNAGTQVVFINEGQIYVKTLSDQDCNNISDFWANFNVNTPTSDLIQHLLYEKREKTLTVDLSKRVLALDKLIAASCSAYSARNHTLLKMIEAFYPNEYKQVVNKLESHGINNLFEEFKSAPYYLNYSSESLFELALVLSSMINADDFPESKFTAEKAVDFLQKADSLLILEGNVFEFKNLDFEWIGPTTLKLSGKNVSKIVNYKELVPVMINSTITLGEGDIKVTLLPGTVEILPALQVATFALENDRKIQETIGYIALDVLGLFIGITEIKAAFKVGSVIRKIAVAADVIGSSSNLAIQLIDEDVIDPVLRNRIQITSAAMAGVGLAFSVIEIGKVVNDMSKTRALYKGKFEAKNLQKFDEIHKYFADVCLENRGIQKEFTDEILSLSPDLKIGGQICDFECKLSTFGCFSGSTEVWTETGRKEIQTINKGDKVWSYNFAKKIKELKPIAGIKNYIVAALFSLVMSSGDTLWATPSHPIYTTSGYKEVAALTVGDTLWSYSGDYERVIGKTLIDTTLQVYDLTIGDNHNYYVGGAGVLVHNNGECFLKNLGNKYNSLATRIDALDEAGKSQFLLDFFDASDDMLRMLDGNPGMVKAWEKFVDDGLPPAFRRNISNLNQRTILDEWAENIANATNKQKGNFGEIGADLDLNAKGYTSLQPRIDNIDSPGHNGIDIVVKKDGQYFIVEGKYKGSASLNPADPTTGLPRQMSDEWITQNNGQRLLEAVGGDQNLVDEILDAGYSRILAKVSPDGSVTYKYVSETGYLNQGGGPLGDWLP